MLDGTVLAVFPLALVRDAIRVRGTDHDLCDRFGYIRGKKMRPAVRFGTGGIGFVHCGARPLVAWVSLKTSLRFGNYCRHCYINDLGQHVFPA